MTIAETVRLFAVLLGGLAGVGAIVALLLIFGNVTLKQIALLMIAGGLFALVWLILSRLSPDALAMAVGLGFGAVACVPAWLMLRAAARRGGRTALLLDEDETDWYLDSRPAAYLLDEGRGVQTVERIQHKQLTGGDYGQRL